MSGRRVRSTLSGSAAERLGIVLVGLAALWLAVLWAVAIP